MIDLAIYNDHQLGLEAMTKFDFADFRISGSY